MALKEQSIEIADIDPNSPKAKALHFAEEHRSELINFAKRRGASWRAEDAFQEAMINIWRFSDDRLSNENIPAFVLKVVRNEAIDHARYDRRRGIPDSIDLHTNINSTNPSPETEVLQLELQEEVIETLSELPTHHEEILRMIDLHGFDYNEVAEAKGIPVGTVKSRLNRGRASFKNKYLHRHKLPDENTNSSTYVMGENEDVPQQ